MARGGLRTGALANVGKRTRTKLKVDKPNIPGPTARHPLDVAAGIDSGKIGMSPASQKTPTAEEISTFQKTGFSSAMADRTLHAGFQEQEKIRMLQEGGRIPGGPSAGLQPMETIPKQPTSLEITQPIQQEGPTSTIQDLPSWKSEFVDSEGILHTPRPLGEAEKAVMAVTGVAGIFLGAVATATALTGNALISSAGLSSPAVARAATGAVVKGKAKLNTYTAAKSVSFLSRLSVHAKKPSFVVGVIASTIGLASTGVGLWGVGEWAKAEGVEGLAFQEQKAKEAGLTELANEIGHDLEVILQQKDTIMAFLPFINIPVSAEKIATKFKAAEAMHKVSSAMDEKLLTEGYTPTIKEQARRAEADAYYSSIRDKNKEPEDKKEQEEKPKW